MNEAMARAENEQSRLSGRRTFDNEAIRYAQRRPTYPSDLFDRLAEYGGLQPGARVLEVGPGTGQATRSLLDRGWSVTAVELGANLAAAARRELADGGDLEVVVGAFEDWEPPADRFDAFVCATAYQWLDPGRRLTRITEALKPGGVVAVIWTHHVPGGTRDFFVRAQDCYAHWDPATAGDQPRPETDIPPTTAEFAESPAFVDVESRGFALELTYSADDYIELLRTYSSTMILPPDRQAGLLGCLHQLIEDRFAGSITKRYFFELVLARHQRPERRAGTVGP